MKSVIRLRIVRCFALLLTVVAVLCTGCTKPAVGIEDTTPDEILQKQLAARFPDAEAWYAVFTGYGNLACSNESIVVGDAQYCRVTEEGFTSLAELRARCLLYFTPELTERLLAKTVATDTPLYLEQDGALWRFGGYAALWGYDVGADGITSYEIDENNGDTVSFLVSRTANIYGKEYTVTVKYNTVLRDGEILFSDFSLPAEAFWRQVSTP